MNNIRSLHDTAGDSCTAIAGLTGDVDRKHQKSRTVYFCFILVSFLEAAAGGALITGHLSTPLFLTVHCIVLLLAALLWRYATKDDLRLLPVGFIALFFTGPVGGAGVVLLAFTLTQGKETPELLDAWYQRLSLCTNHDEETLLYRSIMSGRAPKSGKWKKGQNKMAGVSSFFTIIKTGDLVEKQSLLGIVALKYHPDFLPVLAIALRDRDPTIRVQAAAVYARLQSIYKTRLEKACSRELSEPQSRQALIAELEECTKSGFLDRSDSARAVEAIEKLKACHVVTAISGF